MIFGAQSFTFRKASGLAYCSAIAILKFLRNLNKGTSFKLGIANYLAGPMVWSPTGGCVEIEWEEHDT
jgi:hypothetical protein